MKLVFIDSEPPSKNGGGIRTYIQLVTELCHEIDIQTVVYSHNPGAYRNGASHSIERTPLANWFFRNFLYRFNYTYNLKLEYSNWLYHELKNMATKDTVFEFCDFGGYAYYCLKDSDLQNRVIVKIHTPDFIINRGWFGLLPFFSSGYLERYCLKKALHLIAPSPDFVREKLPGFIRALHIPNPLSAPSELRQNQLADNDVLSFVYFGRIEERKGVNSMIKACHRLAEESHSFHLTIIGYWPESQYAQSVKAQLNFLERKYRKVTVKIRGELDKVELREAIDETICSIIPSLWENSPYAFFESVNSGLYTIGADTGEMGRFLRQIKGALFKPGDAGSLYQSMVFAIENPQAVNKVIQRQHVFYSECYLKNQRVNKEFYLNRFS